MSDDEGGDYGDAYDEDFDAELADDFGQDEGQESEDDKEEKDEEKEEAEEEDKEDETEVAEEAQAEVEAEAEAEAAEGEAVEEEEEPSLSKPAAATKVRVDPLLRTSNTHRRVVLLMGDDRVTSNILKKSEATRAIAIRAKQIESYPVMFTEVVGETDSVVRAKQELLARRCPLKLHRQVGRGPAGEIYMEVWRVSEMVYPPLD
jgi:DNA-directed RNA polymerase subunit K/omega